MSKRWFNNFLAVCFLVLFWAALFLLAGCAGEGLKVNVETSGEGANATKSVQVDTDYQVENGFTMERDGDGYKIELGSATTKDAEAGVMVEMLSMFRAMLGVMVPGFNAGQLAAPTVLPGEQWRAAVLEGRRMAEEDAAALAARRRAEGDTD